MRLRNCSLVLLTLTLALGVSAGDADVGAIRDVVTTAYVEGIHVEGDPAKIRSGFHESFKMFVQADDGIKEIGRDQWIARIEEGNARADRERPEVDHEFTLVDVSGDAAVARVEIHRDGVHTFTDYLSLYRFPDGWRIVSKTFYRHPSE